MHITHPNTSIKYGSPAFLAYYSLPRNEQEEIDEFIKHIKTQEYAGWERTIESKGQKLHVYLLSDKYYLVVDKNSGTIELKDILNRQIVARYKQINDERA